MRYVIVGLVVTLTGCGQPEKPGPFNAAYNAYQACLAEKGVEGCQTEKAQFEAAKAYAETRIKWEAATGASRPPLVLNTYQPPAQQPAPARSTVNCIKTGDLVSCY